MPPTSGRRCCCCCCCCTVAAAAETAAGCNSNRTSWARAANEIIKSLIDSTSRAHQAGSGNKWWWMKLMLLLQLQLHLQHQQQTPKKHHKSGKELQQSSSCGSALLSSAQLSNELVKFQFSTPTYHPPSPLLLWLVSKSFSGFSQWNFKIYNLHLAMASNKSSVGVGTQQVK